MRWRGQAQYSRSSPNVFFPPLPLSVHRSTLRSSSTPTPCICDTARIAPCPSLSRPTRTRRQPRTAATTCPCAQASPLTAAATRMASAAQPVRALSRTTCPGGAMMSWMRRRVSLVARRNLHRELAGVVQEEQRQHWTDWRAGRRSGLGSGQSACMDIGAGACFMPPWKRASRMM